MIRVSDLRKHYQSGEEQVHALRGVSFEIPTGAFTFIVGPSGSGKSTLLYLLGALDIPTSGTIAIDDSVLTSMKEQEQDVVRRKKLGFIFQQFNLIHNLTAVGNVLLPFIPMGASDAVRSKAEDLLKQVGLGNRLSHKPSKLSGGQQQRVAIAAHSSRTRSSCWPTSPPETSTAREATRSSSSCANSRKSAAARSWWSPTIGVLFDRMTGFSRSRMA